MSDLGISLSSKYTICWQTIRQTQSLINEGAQKLNKWKGNNLPEETNALNNTSYSVYVQFHYELIT